MRLWASGLGMQKTLQFFFQAFGHVFPLALGWRFLNIVAKKIPKKLTELFGRFCHFFRI
jgi:hypothetical protein